MRMTYPRSRTNSNGQCKRCRLAAGDMKPAEIVHLGQLELLPLSCSKCGYTEFYNLNIARSVPPPPELGITEVLPE
jgi:predicted nucleic-acid-binding Zn-ribbon protein